MARSKDQETPKAFTRRRCRRCQKVRYLLHFASFWQKEALGEPLAKPRRIWRFICKDCYRNTAAKRTTRHKIEARVRAWDKSQANAKGDRHGS